MSQDEGTLYTIPFQVGPLHYSLMIVLLQESIDRIRQYDPAEVSMPEIEMVHPYGRLALKDIVITYATREEMATVNTLIEVGKWRDALKLLTRGYRYRPEMGDGQGPTLTASTD